MDELEKWMEKNKKLCFVTGIFGLLVAPFLWPFFLAILFHSLSLTVPIILAWTIIKQPWKKKEEPHETIRKGEHRGKNESTAKVHPDSTPADSTSESQKKEGEESVKEKEKEETERKPDTVTCLAITWYQKEGRERIFHIREKVEKEGKTDFSISKDGICSIRKEKGFQRIGILRGYPGKRILLASEELKKDGFSIRETGEYVWICWKKGGMKYAL